ncbi:LysR family transcriptional regulator [Cupriavidus consociatus]|uniref:LysR family transcriptional regulator n=1 Tax=Cupriavidus consociatus TaxID=2821357 RepID=UPI001AE334B6|nr:MULTISPECIES: LysR family transcriptional regulator [unclassified Cupriavidus]MBP0618916.1 LysR family transcriptional regulator [Cupriavidus sp. LEh25]MDK2655559.1 LysR family transcriptional regulator [Cupriavidus sp. LEh21]
MNRSTTFRQLNAIDAVARLGGVSRAAEELHLTQPTVSLQLRLLEQATGTPLVQRVGRGMQLTPAGEVIAGYAGQMLRLWRDAVEEVAALKGDQAGTLRVGAITTAEYLLPPMLVAFTGQRPEVKIKLSVGNREEIIRMLAMHEIDLAIIGRPPSDVRTHATPFAKHPMAFIAAPDHPLMSRRNLSLKDLLNANLLVRERGSGTRNTVERLFKEAGHRLPLGSELSSNAAIKRMVAAGLGVAFLSLHACTLEFQAGLIGLLPLKDNPIERDWYVLNLPGVRIPRVAMAFRAFLIEHGQAEITRQLETFDGILSRLHAKSSGRRDRGRPASRR